VHVIGYNNNLSPNTSAPLTCAGVVGSALTLVGSGSRSILATTKHIAYQLALIHSTYIPRLQSEL